VTRHPTSEHQCTLAQRNGLIRDFKNMLEAVHKRHPQSGGVQCGHFANKGGSLDADVRIFWSKNFRFFEIFGVYARIGGLS